MRWRSRRRRRGKPAEISLYPPLQREGEKLWNDVPLRLFSPTSAWHGAGTTSCGHLFRLYDANVAFLWNSYAAPFISCAETGSQLAGAGKFFSFWCCHEGSFSRRRCEPLFSADVHLAALGDRSSRQDRRGNPAMPGKLMLPASELVIAARTTAGSDPDAIKTPCPRASAFSPRPRSRAAPPRSATR